MRQYYTAIGDQLTQAEIVDYIDCNPEPGSGVKLFGLTAEKLERFHHKKLVTVCDVLLFRVAEIID